MLKDLIHYKGRIEAKKERITPTIDWRNGKKGMLFENSEPA
jgi:hypothetical protein